MAISIITYMNDSDKHVLDKDLTIIDNNVPAILKDDTNIIKPVIIISNNLDLTFNYVYLDVFSRYYFVTDITYSQQRYYVSLEVDPLMSVNSAIKDLDVIANRSSSKYNVYQPDTEIPFLQQNIIATQKFPWGFNTESFILAVNGR